MDSIDKPFLTGKFKSKGKGCVSGGGFQLCYKPLGIKHKKTVSLKKTNNRKQQQQKKPANIANALVDDTLKHISKFLDATFLVTHSYIVTSGSAQNHCSFTGITLIQKKKTPDFLSNPISQLLLTTGREQMIKTASNVV